MPQSDVRARLRDALFLPDGFPPEPAARARTVAAWLALFVVTRLATLACFRLRHVPLRWTDEGNYLAIARFFQAHGQLPTEGVYARQFPGLPFLMVAADHLFHDLVVSGYVVAWGGSLASIALFHAMWRNDRLTAIYTIFVPSWLAASSGIMSEGCTMLLFLVAMRALAVEDLRRQLPLLVVAGYAVVLRNAAVMFLVPLVVAWSLARPRASFGVLALRLAAVLLPVAVYLAYNHATLGVLLPQVEAQRLYFLRKSGTYYPPRLMTWPGHSLLLGLVKPGENVFKRLSVLASLILIVFAGRELWRRARTGPAGEQRLMLALAAGVVVHLAFHLCVGGAFGYSSFDRYVSHVNPALVVALFGARRLRWPWIAALGAVGVVFAGLTGSLPHPP
jgi:hypothetical protein